MMLLDSWILTSLLVAGFFFYNLLTATQTAGQGIRLFNHAVADASIVLIGMSLALSGICHFWNFADTYIGYRKYMGLAGFYMAAAHTAIALTRRPLSSFLTPDRIIPFVAAVLSITLLAVMAAVSNTTAIKRIGYPHWKKILAAGYLAYVAGLVHFGMLNYTRWFTWLEATEPTHTQAPPLSLIVFVFGGFVLGLRVALWIDTRKK